MEYPYTVGTLLICLNMDGGSLDLVLYFVAVRVVGIFGQSVLVYQPKPKSPALKR